MADQRLLGPALFRLSALLTGCACEAAPTAVVAAEPFAPAVSLATPSPTRTARRSFSAADIPTQIPFKAMSEAECEHLVAETRAYLDNEGRRCERDTDCILHQVRCPMGVCYEALNQEGVARSEAALDKHGAGCPFCCNKCVPPTTLVVACRDGACVREQK
jgi:hypothetical protein